MSRSNWSAILAIVGLAALLVLGWWLYERHEQRERSYQAAYQQYRGSKKVVPPGVVAEGQRSVPDPKSYREEWRSERDLEAQREMANWTFYLMVISLGTLVIAAIGVVYVARTLKATRDAVDEAKATTAEASKQTNLAFNTMVRLERPYLYVNVETLLEPTPNGVPFVRCTFANHGKLPATIKSINRRLMPDPTFPLRLLSANKIDAYEVIEPGAKSRGIRVVVEGSERGQWWIDKDIERLVLYLSVTYDGPSGDVFYSDTFCFRGDSRQREFVLTGGDEYNQRGSVGPDPSILNSGAISHGSDS